MVYLTNIVQGHRLLTALSECVSQLQSLEEVFQSFSVVAPGHIHSAAVIEGFGLLRPVFHAVRELDLLLEDVARLVLLIQEVKNNADVAERFGFGSAVGERSKSRERFFVVLEGLSQ